MNKDARRTPSIGDLATLRVDADTRKPILVLSAQAFNEATGLLIACDVLGQATGSPFEVPLGAIAGDCPAAACLVFTLHWRSQDLYVTGAVSAAALDEVRAKLGAVLGGLPGTRSLSAGPLNDV